MDFSFSFEKYIDFFSGAAKISPFSEHLGETRNEFRQHIVLAQKLEKKARFAGLNPLFVDSCQEQIADCFIEKLQVRFAKYKQDRVTNRGNYRKLHTFHQAFKYDNVEETDNIWETIDKVAVRQTLIDSRSKNDCRHVTVEFNFSTIEHAIKQALKRSEHEIDAPISGTLCVQRVIPESDNPRSEYSRFDESIPVTFLPLYYNRPDLYQDQISREEIINSFCDDPEPQSGWLPLFTHLTQEASSGCLVRSSHTLLRPHRYRVYGASDDDDHHAIHCNSELKILSTNCSLGMAA